MTEFRQLCNNDTIKIQRGSSAFEKIRFGLGVYDLGGTNVTYKQNKVDEKLLGQAFKLGIAYFPIDGLTMAMDLDDDRIHVGGEYFIKNRIGFRAGFQQDLNGEEKLKIPSFSIKSKNIGFKKS